MRPVLCSIKAARLLMADDITTLGLFPKRWRSTYNPNAGSALIVIPENNSISGTTYKRNNVYTSLSNIADHQTNAPMFGMAKDRCPTRRSRKNQVYRDESAIRHDALYLKQTTKDGVPDPKRTYTQTWTEFAEPRIRPVTEWGHSDPYKKK